MTLVSLVLPLRPKIRLPFSLKFGYRLILEFDDALKYVINLFILTALHHDADFAIFVLEFHPWLIVIEIFR
jgi:hypothetical protein